MEQQLNVRDAVVLRDDADRAYVSRVEGLGQRLVVVAQPRDLPAGETFGNGREIRIAFAESDGAVTVLPTQILAVHGEDALRLWSLVVTGPSYTEQRRRVERVETDGPVLLRSSTGDESSTVTGNLVDASEKAIRCSVRTGSADHLLRDRSEVVAEFRLGTADFAVPARVEFVRPTKHPTQLEELVVVFVEPVAAADALRKQVFALEPQASSTSDDEEPAGPPQP